MYIHIFDSILVLLHLFNCNNCICICCSFLLLYIWFEYHGSTDHCNINSAGLPVPSAFVLPIIPCFNFKLLYTVQ